MKTEIAGITRANLSISAGPAVASSADLAVESSAPLLETMTSSTSTSKVAMSVPCTTDRPVQCREMPVVQCDQQIGGQMLRPDLRGDMLAGITCPVQGRGGSLVGGFAGVPAIGSGTAHPHPVGQTLPAQRVSEDDLGHR